EKLNDRFKKISGRIYSAFITLRKGVDFMLKFAQSDDEIEDINLFELLSNLFYNIYDDVFKKESIEVQLDLKSNLIVRYNKKAIEDIFDNFITNSIKALKKSNTKKIKCSGIV